MSEGRYKKPKNERRSFTQVVYQDLIVGYNILWKIHK